MNLKFVDTVDFRKNEATLISEFSARESFRALGKDDVVCFVSKTGSQIVFVRGFDALEGKKKALLSTKIRIIGGSWNPLMISNYAMSHGIVLTGIKRFEDHYRHLAEDRRAVAVTEKTIQLSKSNNSKSTTMKVTGTVRSPKNRAKTPQLDQLMVGLRQMATQKITAQRK